MSDMSKRAIDITTAKRPRRARAGFAFTEILFAVMVLGIGFIMLAAMFPVTIKQTQLTVDDSVASGVARSAIAYLGSPGINTDTNFPPTDDIPTSGLFPNPVPPPKVRSMPAAVAPGSAASAIGPGWLATRGNYISAKNPRYAWVPLYMRGHTADEKPSPYAQVFVIVTQSRNQDQYQTHPSPERNYSDVQDRQGAGPQDRTTLEPRLTTVSLEYDSNKLRGKMTIDAGARDLAASGAYVIVADDHLGDMEPPKRVKGQSNGRIYRLGNPVDEANGVWELAPEADMIRVNDKDPSKIVVGDDNNLNGAYAYIIGRGYGDPGNPAGGYSGPAQDIGIYTGFIRIDSPLPLPGTTVP